MYPNLSFPSSLLLHIILPLLKIQHISVHALRLRYQEVRRNRAQNIASEEDPQHVRQANDFRAAEEVEQQRRENRTHLPNRSADAVGQPADARGERFGWDDEGGCVWSEVEEELVECMSVWLRTA
jgi:hypothetical protein